MIKKILGILFGTATIAVVVFAVMGYGNYSSIFWDEATTATATTTEMADDGSAEVSADIVAEPAIVQDSIAGADATAEENAENANADKGAGETSSEEISEDGE